MAKITQTITIFPPAPDSSTDSASVFNTKANNFVAHQSSTYVGEVNTWATEANLLRDEINGIVATIPNGTINDAITTATDTWSSQKIASLAPTITWGAINGNIDTQADLKTKLDAKENSLGLGTAGQVLATNTGATGKEWVDAGSGNTKLTADSKAIVRTDDTWIDNQCSAWVSFNGKTNAKLGHYNVASVSTGATGKYTITFEIPMTSNIYAVVVNCAAGTFGSIGAKGTTNIVIDTRSMSGGGTNIDPDMVDVTIFGGKI